MKRVLSTNRKSILLWIGVLIWMLIILSFSSDPAHVSREKSGLIVQSVEPAIERMEGSFLTKLLDTNKLHHYIRKSAHVFNYFVLTILLIMAWKTKVASDFMLYLLAWMTATLFSILDEIYQTFIPERSGELNDVFIDHIGIISAMLLVYLITIVVSKRLTSKDSF